jgi:hypothetical protein
LGKDEGSRSERRETRNEKIEPRRKLKDEGGRMKA